MSASTDWHELDSTACESTISYFVGGFANHDNDSVLIWHGVERDDGIHLRSHLGNEVPEDARYILEIKSDGDLVDEKFASSEAEAFSKARKVIGDGN